MLDVMLDAWTSFAQAPWRLPSGTAPFAPPAPPGGGTFVARRFDAEEGSLRYKLFVPSGHADVPMPLVVMLHGGGQDADDFALGTGMNELAEQHRCIVLYPQQSASANWTRCWNWFDDTHHHRGRGEPEMIAALTRSVMADHPVDAARVYVAGLSAGGAMAVILGRTYPDLFAAVGCHSGLAHGSASDGAGAMRAMQDGVDARALPAQGAHQGRAARPPVIVFHGDADMTVHPSNGASVVEQFLASEQAAVSESAGRARGRAFTRQVHRGRDGRVVAEHWSIDGFGHAWSGGAGRGRYADPDGPDASKEMLRFFLQHRQKSLWCFLAPGLA